MMPSPVLYLIFNRPDLMQQSFARIRDAQPPKLFIAADGPRLDREGETVKCAEARRIVEQVDWTCEVHTLFRDHNLGCRKAISEAITWFFQHVEEGIILEDDCIAAPTFFRFCGELLDRYRFENRIMAISGDNFQTLGFKCRDSYYFSKYPHCIGWATWRRAWLLYDQRMTEWPAYRYSVQFLMWLRSPRQWVYWYHIFQDCYNQVRNSWAYVWTYSCWINEGLTVLPRCNMVEHIGWGENATNSADINNEYWHKAFDITFPLDSPDIVSVNHHADRHTDKVIFSGGSPWIIPLLLRYKWKGSLFVRKKIKQILS